MTALPFILSTGLALIYLSWMPTVDQLIRASTGEVPKPGSDGWFEWALFITGPVHIADLVRLNLYSGLIFGSLSLLVLAAIRKVETSQIDARR